MAGWTNWTAAGVLAAAMATAGPAAAGTVLTQTLNLALTPAAPSYQGQFDLGGVLHDGDGRTFKATAGRISTSGFSAAAFGPPSVSSLDFPAFNTFEIGPDFTINRVTIFTHNRFFNHLDQLPDTATLSAGVHFVADTVSAEPSSQAFETSSTEQITSLGPPVTITRHQFNDSHVYSGFYGALDLGLDLDFVALFLLNSNETLDFSLMMLGQATFDSVSLSLDLMQTGGPPPGAPPTSPAPEPATWALLIAGFALAGAALRRQAGHRAGLARSAGIGRHPTAHPRGGGDPG